MPEKARIGIIGAGWWATEYHIPGVLEHPQAELAAVCDSHAGRLEQAATAYNLKQTYLDYQEMLAAEQLDGAIIATPHATHYAIARDCLEKNLHVLIEKPMTLYARHARLLLDLAGARHKEIVLGYTAHYSKQAQRARQVVQAGELGAVQYLTSSFSSGVSVLLSGHYTPDPSSSRYRVHGPSENYNRPELLGGGQGHLQLTHSIGWLFYTTGLRARRVQAMMKEHGLAVDLVDAFTVEFEGGALGLVGGTGNAHVGNRMALAVYGSEGCYVADTLSRYAAIHRNGAEPESLDWSPTTNSRHPVTENFIEVIFGREPNHAPGEVGWRAVELLDAAYRSVHEHGRLVSMEELYR